MTTITRPSSSSAKFDSKLRQPHSNQGPGKQALAIIQILGEFTLLLLKILWLIGEATYRLFVPVEEKSVKGEIVLITGAGHGIGKELALQYASHGAIVVCWDISKVTNLETVEEIAKLGYPKAYSYVCNVSKREEVMETAKKVQKEVGNVTILINNAGIMPCHSFFDHTVDEIERIMNINVMAHYWTLQAFLPTMKQRNHGHIVAISSLAGLMGMRNLVPYCASKFAVRGMMEALYQDLKADPKCQIKTTTVYPYAVNTGLCKRPKIRFPKLLALLNARDVAECIVSAQRRDAFEVTIPKYFLSLLCHLRLYPTKAVIEMNKFVDSYIDSDL